MNGLHYDDWNSFLEQRAGDRNWKWPLNLAIAFHIAVFAGAVILPDLIEHRPLHDDIVTVDLISMPEPPAAAAPPAATEPIVKAPEPVSAPPPVEAPEPVIEPEVAAVPVTVEPEIAPEPVAPAAPISLKPLKRKKRIAKDTRLAEVKEREQRTKALKQEKQKKLEKLAQQKADQARKKRAEQARRQKVLTDARHDQQNAERAAARARQNLASVIRDDGAVNAAVTGSTGNSSGRKTSNAAITNQYGLSLKNRISSSWKLPEMVKRNNNLTTMVALTVRRDGSIANMQIQRKSGDAFFDQSVMKALRSASPMPPFPVLISEPSLKFALNFTPQGLAM